MEFLNATIAECFKERVEKNPDKVAIEYGDDSFTWKQIDEISDNLVQLFWDAGIRKGTHTGICCRNNPAWVCTFIALQKIGSVAVLMNPGCTTREADNFVQIAGVEFFCYDQKEKTEDYQKVMEGVPRLNKGSNVVYIGDLNKKNIQKNTLINDGQKKAVKPDDTACILFTSGSTSLPKAVMLSGYSIVNTSNRVYQTMGWTQEDKICVIAPLYHVLGLVAGFLASVHSGGSIVLTDNIIKLMKTIEKYRCTVLNGVPSMFLSMVNNKSLGKYDLSSLKSGFAGGSFLSRKDYIKIRDTLHLDNFQISYGITEASGGFTYTCFNEINPAVSDNVGKAILGIEVKIADAFSQNQIGEVLVKGFSIMKGYYNNIEETEKTIDEEGWLHTGDLGYLDVDNDLHLTGRKKEVIIRNGEKISPYEIEECILDYPGIAMTKVLGVNAEVTQEEIAACIFLKERAEYDENKFRKYLEEHLALYKIPKYLLILDSFPMTPNGKIDLSTLTNLVNEKVRNV